MSDKEANETTEKPVEAEPAVAEAKADVPAEEPKTEVAEEATAEATAAANVETDQAAEASKSPTSKTGEESAPEEKKKSALNQEFTLFHTVSQLDIALAIKHLSILLKSGVTIGEAVQVIGEQSNDSMLRKIFVEVRTNLNEGKTLSESLRKYPKVFSDTVVSIIMTGEQGATLEKNLIFLSDFLKKEYELNKKVKGAMVYPAIIFVMTISELLGMMLFILPQLETLFKGFNNIPPLTLAILGFSKFLKENGLYVLGGFGAFAVLFKLFTTTKPGAAFTDWVSLNFPVISRLNKTNMVASFSRTVSIMLESGIPLSTVIKGTVDTVNSGIYKKVLIQVQQDIEKGKTLAESLSTHPQFFDKTYVKMIEVSEKTGSLEDSLKYLYELYAEEVEEISTNLTTLLEPILMIFLGVCIGLLAITVIGPIYQLTSSINK
jgi:type IV pilus assembly protein PilC